MDEIIFRSLSGEVTRFEEERLKKWRAEDPENEDRVQTLAKLWNLTEPGDTETLPSSKMERLAESIISTAEERRKVARNLPAMRPRKSRAQPLLPRALTWGTAIAAGVAALALGLGSLGDSGSVSPESESGYSIALTSQTLRLDDGSFVRLSPGSSLEAHIDQDRRGVTLDGRAFFAISPDSGRPFVVTTREGEIRVLGTRFEVSGEGGQLRTIVLEGRVALSTPGGVVEVPGGSVGTAMGGEAPKSTAVEDVLVLLDWPGGLLVFHSTPLSSVAREVARHFGASFTLDPSSNTDPRISASFEGGEDFREIVETLCSVTRSECRITGDSAVITPPMGGQR